MRKYILMLVVALSIPEAASAQAWTSEEVTVARHCASEASFAHTGDCRVIAWIDQRNAERRGLTIEAWMARSHARHLQNPGRPWIAGLNAEATEPAGWPTNYPWMSARPRWLEMLAEVRDVLRYGEGHGCNGTPLVWGSPQVDRDRLDRWYARGYRRLICEGGTRNEIVGS